MESQVKSLIWGSKGFLGGYLKSFLSDIGINFLAYRTADGRFEIEHSNEVVYSGYFDEKGLNKAVRMASPNYMVNAIALTNFEECQRAPEKAYLANSEVPKWLARSSYDHGVKLIHISTDAVFEQLGGKFVEGDDPIPNSIYGQSKRSGEVNVQQNLENSIIARTNFFGFSSHRPSLFNYFYNNLVEERNVNGFEDVLFNPIYVKDLVSILEKLATSSFTGIIHLTGSETLSKYDFGSLIRSNLSMEIAGKVLKSEQVKSSSYARKSDLTLDNSLLSSMYKFDYTLHSGVKDAIQDAKKESE
jgi:dTDP-4-dehydrorhamnose reductase